MELSAPQEDYLETIGHLCRENGAARVSEIAARHGVSTATVVGALRSLKQRNLLCQPPYGQITLTSEGQAAAESVMARHAALHAFLVGVLGVDGPTAERDACRIEHDVSPATLRRLIALERFLARGPWADVDWRGEFERFLATEEQQGATG